MGLLRSILVAYRFQEKQIWLGMEKYLGRWLGLEQLGLEWRLGMERSILLPTGSRLWLEWLRLEKQLA